MIEKVKDLFHDHTELILGFNTFLPKVGPPPPSPPLGLPAAATAPPAACLLAITVAEWAVILLLPVLLLLPVQGYEIRIEDIQPVRLCVGRGDQRETVRPCSCQTKQLGGRA